MTSILDRFPTLFKGKEELDLISGGIGWPLFYLALPLVITNLLQTAYNLADTIWLGQYSTEALAAISFAFPLVFLFISIGLGISIAGSVLVAQRTGSGDEEGVKKAASQTLLYSVLSSAILGGIGYFVVGHVIRLFGAGPEVAPLATNYMQIINLGLVFLFGFIVFTALSRGAGDTITPMILMAGSVALNIVLDPILIFGFQSNPLFIWTGLTELQAILFNVTGYTGNGIEGAAYATIISRSLAFFVGLYFMFATERSVTVSLSRMAPDLDELKELVSIGAYASVETLSRSISVNLMLFVVGLFATPIVAGYGIGVRIFSVIFLPAVAVSQSVETMTGQNYGANKYERVTKVNNLSARWMFGILSVLAILIFVAAEPLANVFSNDPRVIRVTKQFIRIVAPTFGFVGVMRAYSGGFRGLGKTTLSALIAVCTLGFTRLPVAYVLSQIQGFTGIWYAFAISNTVGALLALILFKRLHKRVM